MKKVIFSMVLIGSMIATIGKAAPIGIGTTDKIGIGESAPIGIGIGDQIGIGNQIGIGIGEPIGIYPIGIG